MNTDDIIIVEYSSVHSDELVRMWRRSFESAVGITDPHSIEEQREYLAETVVPGNQVLVVLSKQTAKVIGLHPGDCTVTVDPASPALGSCVVCDSDGAATPNVVKGHLGMCSRSLCPLFGYRLLHGNGLLGANEPR